MNRKEFVKTSVIGAGAVAASGLLLGREGEESPSKPPKIKIGQLGIGHAHAGERMRSLKRLSEDFEIVGVVDERHTTDEITRGGKSAAYEGLEWMTEEELLSTPGLQAVMVETANLELVPASLRCVERGLAICMDKPGGDDLAAYEKLLDACRDKKLPFQIAYMLRTNPAIQFVGKAVREGWLGEVFEIQASMSHDYGNEGYRRYLSAYPGGIMFLLGCHHIDWIAHLLGRPLKVTPFLGSTRHGDGSAENNCWTILEYPHVIVSIHASDSEAGGAGRRRIKVCGTKGTIEFSPIERFDGTPLKLDLLLKEAAGDYAEGSHTVEFGVTTDRYVEQLKEFASMMRGETESPFSHEHDLLVQEILLAASGALTWK